jgi:hypothetical protein
MRIFEAQYITCCHMVINEELPDGRLIQREGIYDNVAALVEAARCKADNEGYLIRIPQRNAET